MKKFLAVLLLVTTVVTSGSISSAGTIEDEQWNSPEVSTPTYHGITIQNGGNEISTFSYLLALFNRDTNPSNFDRYVCKSTQDTNCVNPDQYDYNSILPTCTSDAQTDCVEGLTATNAQGMTTDGKFSKYTNANHPNIFVGDQSKGIPDDISPGIWTIDGAPHAFGSQYVVSVALSGHVWKQGGGTQSLNAVITPVSEINGGASPEQAYCRTWLDPARNHYNNACSIWLTPANANYKCAYVLGDYKTGTPNCLLSHAFPINTKFKLAIRLKSEPVTWFHGRLTDPEINISKVTNGVKLEVNALPVKVPVASYGAVWNSLPKPISDFWQKCETQFSQSFQCSGAGNFGDPLPLRTGTMLLPPYGNAAMEAIQAIAQVTDDKSIVSPDAWMFNTLPSNSGTSDCFTSGTGVKGIVTTNSTAYAEGPPTFDGSSLNYKVASLHYNPDGSVFKGTYNLVVRSDVARCLYNFTSAPIKASISVISADGSNDIATTVANEKNGWLYLSANGFTFSSPTVKVKLSQDAPAPTASPSPSDSPTPDSAATPGTNALGQARPLTVQKKTTITCIKGKSTKSVTGVKPTCPIGYKKK